MSCYDEIKSKLIDNEIYERVKDYAKERNIVITYYKVGRLLADAGKKYGEDIIGEYSKKLVIDVGKKYNLRTLFRMKQFYNVFSNEKVSPVATVLTWSHIRLLLSINYTSINYYIKIVIYNHISVRDLEYKIKSNEYERLPEETKSNLINKEGYKLIDFVNDPILIKNNRYAIKYCSDKRIIAREYELV